MFGEKMHLEEDESSPIQFTKRAKSNAGRASQIDMTPMVDVVFQLLTFFLLAVKRDSAEPVDVPVTVRSTAVAESQSTFITVKPPSKGSPDPEIILGDRSGNGDKITADQVRDEVVKGVNAGRPNIIIKAERFVSHGDVLKVCRIVDKVEGAFLYVGVQSKE